MNIVVTCGPSHEPIDGARRLTNMSTGTLGILLANALTAAGHRVHCFKGEMASTQIPLDSLSPPTIFSTNDDLVEKLRRIDMPDSIDAVFHAAALCDFKVAAAVDNAGNQLAQKKLSTRSGGLTLQLEPTTKVLPLLKSIFPKAQIIGWKYELDGSREDAFERARRQVETNGTFACVLNGAAYGSGFAICRPDLPPAHCQDHEALNQVLISLLDVET